MISDRDIYAAAKLFIQRHGEEAAIQAAFHADEFGAENDVFSRAPRHRVGTGQNLNV